MPLLQNDLLACMDPCVDTETTGLDAFGRPDRARDHVIGVAIDTGREAYYLPFRHGLGCPAGEGPQQLPCSLLEPDGLIGRYLSDEHRTYLGFNYGFDLHMLAAEGIAIPPKFEDAMLALHLVNENEPSFKLKEVCEFDYQSECHCSKTKMRVYLLPR